MVDKLDIFYQSGEVYFPQQRRSLGTQTLVQGVFLDVFGKGVLLTGAPGIGKSDCALQLLTRQHRLIADDAVLFYRDNSSKVKGFCPLWLHNALHVRSLGIIDVKQRFGPLSVQSEKELDLIIELQSQTPIVKVETRLVSKFVLCYPVPSLSLTLTSLQNAAILIETAIQYAFSQPSMTLKRLLDPNALTLEYEKE